MDKQEVSDLLDRYASNQCLEEERALVEAHYAYLIDERKADNKGFDFQAAKGEIWAGVQQQIRPISKLSLYVRYLAATVAAITFGTWLYVHEIASSRKASRNDEVVMNDIAPGSVGATLTLANGKTIKLSSATNGELAKEAGVTIKKTDDGQLIYEIASSRNASRNDEGEAKINTLSTAKGETYQVKLPDGTAVWLNAASSLTYNTYLNEKGKRKVTLQGEAYFQVAKDKAHPFIVETSKQRVEVLGTHFSVNAYADEASTKTTLLEGSVCVSPLLSSSLLRGRTEAQVGPSLPERMTKQPRGPSTEQGQNKNEIATARAELGSVSRSASRNDGQGVRMTSIGGTILKPGQQSVLTDDNRITVKEVDAQSYIDWKNGEFVFEHETIQSIMRKLSRWYDVEIEYAGLPEHNDFSGAMSRSETIGQVLRKIELTNQVHFKIEGRRITIMR